MTQRSPLRAAVAQLCSQQNRAENLQTAQNLLKAAVQQGADLVAFPEMTPYLGYSHERLALMEPLSGPTVQHFCDMARTHQCAVLLGSTAETGPDPQHSFNTSVFIDHTGQILTSYRKIHLFDVHIEGVVSMRESDSMAPGDPTQRPIASWRDWNIGLTICYDLRFPELYRALTHLGAHILTVPAAFTAQTGPDHWMALLKARAIENQCFVIAPNQWGHHLKKRRSHGRSAILDPWGNILAQVPDRVGFAIATLDPNDQDATRSRMPCLQHARLHNPNTP